MSTYNKKLPKPSEICFMKTDRTGRTDKITMPFKGVVPSNGISFVSWRQSSYAYSYQVQYYVKARMIPDKQLQTGAEYTKTDWKYFNPTWSGNVNTMNKCVTMDKQHRYYRYYGFGGKSLMTKGSYDKLEVVVRVRSFNKTKKQHGDWVSKTLKILCKPTVTVHRIVALADGGFNLYLNTNGWKRGDSEVILKDVRHTGASKKENKQNLIDEVGAIGTEEASGYPYATFKGSNFNTDFEQSESITLKNCVFRTCDGVDVSLDGTYKISSIDADISEPAVTVAINHDKAELDVFVEKQAGQTGDDWDSVQCWMICDGKRFDTLVDYGQTDDEQRFYRFHPPFDKELQLRVSITNNLGGKFTKTYNSSTHRWLKPIPSNGRIQLDYTDGTDEQLDNGMFYGSKYVSMNYEVEYSMDANRKYETELPFGRSRPVAFLGEGVNRAIKLKGSIDSSKDGFFETVAHSTHNDWLEFQEHQGIVFLRMPEGKHYTALCTNVNISHEEEADETRTVDISLEEVEI